MMRHNAPPIEGDTVLSSKQERVLEMLLSGSTVSDAARVSEVDRATVHRWLRSHPRFRARVNGGRDALRRAAEARLEVLAEQALDVVGRALDRADTQAAIAVLRGVGLLSGKAQPIGSSDPYLIKAEDGSRQFNEELQASFASWPGSESES